MFQYISEIIKNISPKQRLWALFITLVFVLLITLGGNIIDAFSSSDRVLQNRIESLETANVSLNNQNRELQTIIIESQIQCTKDITQVRQQILDELDRIEREMKMAESRMEIRPTDSVQSAPRVIQLPNPAMVRISSMKNQLKTDMEKSK